jgi:hypothetical protein
MKYNEDEKICEDPIYFLGRKEYQRNPKLTDYQEWAKQLELAKERKYNFFVKGLLE